MGLKTSGSKMAPRVVRYQPNPPFTYRFTQSMPRKETAVPEGQSDHSLLYVIQRQMQREGQRPRHDLSW